MKKVLLLISICGLLFLSSGCVSVKQNTYDINQLKSQMANVESVLARQNLLIQQNKTEVDTLYTRNDEISIALGNQKTASFARPSRTTTQSIGFQAAVPSSDILSDKLVPQPSINQVQISLRNAGFYIGKIDGKVGPMTKDAVVAFQKANGLTSDGIVGKRTWEKLKEYL